MKKILIADDSSTIRRIVKDILKSMGFQDIIEAKDGEDALTKMEGVNLLISDWNMPKRNGLNLIQVIRTRNEIYRTIPIIMVTTESQKDDVEQALKSGVDAYIIKPFQADHLRRQVDIVLSMKKSMKLLVVDDFKSIRQIVIRALSELGFNHIEEAENGLEALEKTKEGVDFLITDWIMPKMSGLELVKAIRTSTESYKDIPIMMVTTQAEKISVIEAIRNGVDNYIIKPFTAEILKNKMTQVFAIKYDKMGVKTNSGKKKN